MDIDSLLAVVDVDTLDTFTQFTPANTPAFGTMMFQMIIMLLFLSALLYFALYFIRKLNNRYKYKNDSISFKLHENLYFSSKQGISAISFGNKVYIVGFSQNNVNVIDIIDDPEVIATLTTPKPQNNNFIDIFKNFFQKTK
jgi:flagellar biogenesis protein FliO